MVDMVAIVAAINALMPPFVSLVVQAGWRRPVKAMVALSCCMLIGVLTVYAHGGNFADYTVAIPAGVAAMETSYRLYWKATGIAPWIEDLTSLIRRPDIEV